MYIETDLKEFAKNTRFARCRSPTLVSYLLCTCTKCFKTPLPFWSNWQGAGKLSVAIKSKIEPKGAKSSYFFGTALDFWSGIIPNSWNELIYWSLVDILLLQSKTVVHVSSCQEKYEVTEWLPVPNLDFLILIHVLFVFYYGDVLWSRLRINYSCRMFLLPSCIDYSDSTNLLKEPDFNSGINQYLVFWVLYYTMFYISFTWQYPRYGYRVLA